MSDKPFELDSDLRNKALNKANEEKKASSKSTDTSEDSNKKVDDSNPTDIDNQSIKRNKSEDKKTENQKIEDQNRKIAEKTFDLKEKMIFNILEKESNMTEPRNKMKRNIMYFLGSQMIFLAFLITGILIGKGCWQLFSDKVFLELLNFLKYYIAAIIVEFISMIFFVVKYLFSTKLIDILQNWFDKI